MKSEVLGVGGNWHTVLKPIDKESHSGGLRPVGSWCHYKCDIMSTASLSTIRRVILTCRATPITFNHCFFACSCRRLQTFSFLFFFPPFFITACVTPSLALSLCLPSRTGSCAQGSGHGCTRRTEYRTGSMAARRFSVCGSEQIFLD